MHDNFFYDYGHAILVYVQENGHSLLVTRIVNDLGVIYYNSSKEKSGKELQVQPDIVQ